MQFATVQAKEAHNCLTKTTLRYSSHLFELGKPNNSQQDVSKYKVSQAGRLYFQEKLNCCIKHLTGTPYVFVTLQKIYYS